jgi:pimeloyl-ACP methyl ester carboxylesterase
MGDGTRGGVIPVDLVRRIGIPTFVIAGGESPDFFRDSAMRIVELLRDGELVVLDGADHGAPAEVVAPVITRLLSNRGHR